MGNILQAPLRDDPSPAISYPSILPLKGTLLLFSITFMAVSSSLAAAEEASKGIEKSLELIKEEESVNIAMRREQPISQAPSNVYVITAEDIRHSGAIDIPTLLRRIPGIEVMQTTGGDFNVSVRGDNQPAANKLLVMVDGRSIYVDAQGIVLWKLLPVTLPEIKRIEVLKGPSSAIYGFNAFDGVINIITKSPGEIKGTTLQIGGGNFGTISTSAIQAGTVNKFGYRLSVGANQNASWNNSSTLAFRDYLFNAQTEYAFTSSSKLIVSGGLVDSNRWEGLSGPDSVITLKPSQAYANVTYQYSDLVVRTFWNRWDSSSLQQFAPALAPFQTISATNGNQTDPTVADTYNVDIQHGVAFGPTNRLTYGINYRLNTLSSDFTGSQHSSESRLGFYIQDEWKLGKAITLVGGVRYDLHSFIHPTTSPRVALLYNLTPDHTFRVSGSVAYRPPTLFEKNVNLIVTTNPPLPAVTTPIVGGASLSPEQIISYEGEYQGWYFKHRLRTRGAVFYNHISDLIATKDVAPNSATTGNDPGSADIYGAEIGAEFLITKWLSAFANYSYQKINQTFTGNVKRAGPHNKFNIGMRGDWDNGLSTEAIYHYYGSVIYPSGASFTSLSQAGLVSLPNPTVGRYTLLNLRGAYRFWQQKAAGGYMRQAELAMSVFNALNDKAKEYSIGEEIGRRFMGWLTVRF